MKIIFQGKEYESVKECYEDNKSLAKIGWATFKHRLKEGMSIEEALLSAKRNRKRTVLGSHLVEGVEYHNLPALARAYGMKEMAMYKRHHRGFRGDDLIPLKKRKSYVPPEPPVPVRQVEIYGVKYKNISAALRELGVEKHTFYNRRARNYPLAQCLNLEPFADKRKTRAKTFEYQGESLTLRDIEDRFYVYSSTFLARLERGCSVEEALSKRTYGKLAPAEDRKKS